MSTHTFNASAGYHLANAGTNRNVVLGEQICGLEKNRIQASNEPEITRLQSVIKSLERERRDLQGILAIALRPSVAQLDWPIWQTMMLAIFLIAAFSLTKMSLEPFDLNPELLWLCSIGIACLCAYATAEFLERTDLNIVILGLSVVLFISSLVGLMMLASVRADIFALHLQNLAPSIDTGSNAPSENALAFYRAALPKLRLFLLLLGVSLELAAGLALHGVKRILRARRQPPSPESRRLQIIEQEIGRMGARLNSLQNEPDVFEHEYRRNFLIGLLNAAADHAESHKKWLSVLPVLIVLGIGFTLRAQPVNLLEGLDYSATSKAADYDGTMAVAQNLDAAARVIASLPGGSRVTVSAISDQSFSRPFVLLQGEIPTSRGPLREYDEISAARNRLVVAVRRIGSSIEPKFKATDILGFVVRAGLAFRNTPHERHLLVIFSDMRQSAAGLDIEHVELVPVDSALAAVEEQQLVADLSGTEVFIYGVHSIGKDIRYWNSLRRFWATYFEQCHAHLRAFSMTRDVPNFAGAY